MSEANFNVSATRWYDWEKIGTQNDPRKRKQQLKEARKNESVKPGTSASAYFPPWPDELAAIESVLGISQNWLVTGAGEPFAHPENRRASDRDPLYGEITEIYGSLTDEQKKALATLIKPFRRSSD